MDAFSVLRHLERVHRQQAAVLDADDSNRLHHRLHAGGADHEHSWAGRVADPQPPLRKKAST